MHHPDVVALIVDRGVPVAGGGPAAVRGCRLDPGQRLVPAQVTRRGAAPGPLPVPVLEPGESTYRGAPRPATSTRTAGGLGEETSGREVQDVAGHRLRDRPVRARSAASWRAAAVTKGWLCGPVQRVAALVALQPVLLRRRQVAELLVGQRGDRDPLHAEVGADGRRDPPAGLDRHLERQRRDDGRADAQQLERQDAREGRRRDDPVVQRPPADDPFRAVRARARTASGSSAETAGSGARPGWCSRTRRRRWPRRRPAAGG